MVKKERWVLLVIMDEMAFQVNLAGQVIVVAQVSLEEWVNQGPLVSEVTMEHLGNQGCLEQMDNLDKMVRMGEMALMVILAGMVVRELLGYLAMTDFLGSLVNLENKVFLVNLEYQVLLDCLVIVEMMALQDVQVIVVRMVMMVDLVNPDKMEILDREDLMGGLDRMEDQVQ